MVAIDIIQPLMSVIPVGGLSRNKDCIEDETIGIW